MKKKKLESLLGDVRGLITSRVSSLGFVSKGKNKWVRDDGWRLIDMEVSLNDKKHEWATLLDVQISSKIYLKNGVASYTTFDFDNLGNLDGGAPCFDLPGFWSGNINFLKRIEDCLSKAEKWYAKTSSPQKAIEHLVSDDYQGTGKGSEIYMMLKNELERLINRETKK